MKTRWVTLLLALVYLPAAALTLKKTSSADVHFALNSVSLPGYHQKLDGIACQARQHVLDVVVVVGHADARERSALELSVRRAHAVRFRLAQLGVPFDRIYVEGKGARNPMGGAMNRRVEVELVASYGKSAGSCEPGWDQAFLELPIPGALALANSLVRDGQWAAHVAPMAAIRARKLDYLDAMLNGPHRLRIDRADGPQLLRAAVMWGGPAFVHRLIAWGVRKQGLQMGLPLIWLACDSDRTQWSDKELEEMAAALLAWGAAPQWLHDNSGRPRTALQCASDRGARSLAGLLLRHGADPDATALLLGARHPGIALRLIAAGADPKAQTPDGHTLFHRYVFTAPAEVEWLVGLGLDINAKSSNGETPLQSAVYHAKKDVLDEFLRHGADISAAVPRWGWPLLNLEAAVWLIDQGAPLANVATLCRQAAWHGDKTLPAFDALARRGIDFADRKVVPDTVVKQAVDALAPQLVAWLLAHGALSRGAETTAMRAHADRVPLFQRPYMMHSSAESIAAFNTEAHLEERHQRKQRIIELLSAHE